MQMTTYTEEDLKRAFECGHTVGVGFGQGEHPSKALSDVVDTPDWVHKTNMSLFVWQFISWERAKHWILNPAFKGLTAKEQIELDGGRDSWSGNQSAN
jgi:hypothetical protein